HTEPQICRARSSVHQPVPTISRERTDASVRATGASGVGASAPAGTRPLKSSPRRESVVSLPVSWPRCGPRARRACDRSTRASPSFLGGSALYPRHVLLEAVGGLRQRANIRELTPAVADERVR